MICGPGGSKSRLATAAGSEPAGQMRDEELHAVLARSTFPSQNAQNLSSGALLEVVMSKKLVHDVVARSTFQSQKCKKTDGFRPLLEIELRCRKSARRCGAKHISMSKCSKHDMFGPLLTFRCCYAWQAQGIVHLVKSEQNVRVLQHF